MDNINNCSNNTLNGDKEQVYNFRWWCYKVLPLVYDDSLSYYEVLCKVSAKLNEVIDFVNKFQDSINDYTDQQIAILDEKLTQQIQLVEHNLTVKIEQTNENLATEIKRLEIEIASKVNELYSTLLNNQEALYKYIDGKIADLIAKIPDLMGIEVMNPVRGYITSLQQALNDLYDNSRYYAITCIGFDSLGLTAKGFDDLNITAYEFDNFFGRYYNRDDLSYMQDPFDGKTKPVRDVVIELFNLHYPREITATSFDNANTTAENFDALLLTAFNFDTTGLTPVA